MKTLCNDLWKEILLFIGFSILDIRFSLTSKFFYQVLFPMWLKYSFVCIPILKTQSTKLLQSKTWVIKYAWCINQLHCDYLLDCIFPRLSYLQISNQQFIELSRQNFPNLIHLEILGPNKYININELSLISFYIGSNLDFQFKSNTLQFLAFHTCFSYDGTIKLLKNLPNLKYLQLDDYDGRNRLKKAFPRVRVDMNYQHYGSTWLKLMSADFYQKKN